MTRIHALLERNSAFAETPAKDAVPAIPFHPNRGLYIVTCIDPRVDPSDILGLELGDAIVARNVGGRVTEATLEDIAYISYLVESKTPDGPWFEVAVIHHTDCGSQLLADEELRAGFLARTGYTDGDRLASTPVLDPAATAGADAELVRSAPQVSANVTVSAHVYNVSTGLLTTVAPAQSR